MMQIEEIEMSKAKFFDCASGVERDPLETKGKRYKKTLDSASACMDEGCC